MSRSVVLMFSGQGSQYYHMGRQLFKTHPVFQEWMLKLNDIASDLIGESLLDILYDDSKRSSERFDRTLYTHPSIFMMEYSLAQVLLESGIEPDYVMGASLGEFTAAAVSAVMSVEELLELLVKQARLLEACCEKGGMLAILHDINLYYDTPALYENSELASVNYNSHSVVSGKRERLQKTEAFMRDNDIVYQDLPVSHAFHSSLIDSAAAQYKKLLGDRQYQFPQIRFVSCLSGTILTSLPCHFFWNVIREPIQFIKAVHELEDGQKKIYIDLGPSGTLANFIKYNLKQDSASESHAIITPFGQEAKQLAKIQQLFKKCGKGIEK